MFGKTKEELMNEIVELKRLLIDTEVLKSQHKREVSDLCHKHSIEIEKKDADFAIEKKDLEFKMKNHKDSEILEKDKEISTLKTEKGILEKEVEMMKEMVDLNADIVNVGDIINKLIEKLPQLNLTSLTLQAGSKKEE